MPGIEDWSTTAASNSSADSNINWAEGQLPSTVNNSARAMMAAMAAFLRTAGAYGTVGGTGNAITLTTTQTPSGLGPALIGFIAGADNTGAVTLNRDGLGAKPLRYTSGVDLSSGDIVTGRFYLAAYTTASSGQWLLVGKNVISLSSLPTQNDLTVLGNFSGGSAVPSANTMATLGANLGYLAAPSGTVMLFKQTAAPTGWTKDTSHNNKALRLVSGTVSTGGSTAFTSVFTSRTIAEANLPSHTHSVTDAGHTHGVSWSGGAANSSTTTYVATTTNSGVTFTQTTASNTTGITIGNTGSGTAMDFAVQYVDVILAMKD